MENINFLCYYCFKIESYLLVPRRLKLLQFFFSIHLKHSEKTTKLNKLDSWVPTEGFYSCCSSFHVLLLTKCYLLEQCSAQVHSSLLHSANGYCDGPYVPSSQLSSGWRLNEEGGFGPNKLRIQL